MSRLIPVSCLYGKYEATTLLRPLRQATTIQIHSLCLKGDFFVSIAATAVIDFCGRFFYSYHCSFWQWPFLNFYISSSESIKEIEN